MSIPQIIYLSLLGLTFIISLASHKHHKSFKVLSVLLGVGVLTEVLFNAFYYLYDKDYFIFYQVYIPLEYYLLSWFFYLANERPLTKKIILSIIPVYTLIVIMLYAKIYKVEDYPGLVYNINGTLIISWAIITLFSIEPVLEIPLIKIPVFWVCVGLVIFYTGIFYFNGVYGFLFKNNKGMSEALLNHINKAFNYLLYSCFIIAFVCSNRMKKYSSQS